MSSVGVVLAGGQSSRMGRDKALLEWQGRTLLEHAVQLLQAAGVCQLLVSGRPDHPLGIPDLFLHAGPPAAVYALLHHLEATGALDDRPLLLIPVDMPNLQVSSLAMLLEAYQAGQAVRFAGQVFPCVFPASQVLLQHLRELYAVGQARGGERSMKGILDWLSCTVLAAPQGATREFLNVNTPEDWGELC